MGFFLLFPIENSCHIILVFSKWEWYQPYVNIMVVGFPPPQNSAIPTFIKKAESQISLLSFGVGFFGF